MADTNPQANPTPPRKGAGRAALRMVVYPVLAIGLVTVLVFTPRVQEEYYHWRWSQAEDEVERAINFNELLALNPPTSRLHLALA